MVKAAARRYAVIDIGSNAVRLQIGALAAGKILTEVFTRIPLGLGGAAFGGRRRKISAASCRRLGDTLIGMRHLIDSMKPCRYSAIATAALRDAANREQVVEAIRQRCGIAVRVLTGSEEAAVTGCYAAGHFSAAAVMNADIGGGSTDCALIGGGKLKEVATFAIGTARAGGGSAEEKARCRDWLRQHIPAAAVVSSSGGSALQLQQCCGKLTEQRLSRWRRQIKGLSVAEIAARYQMSPDRAAHVADAVDIYRLILSATAIGEIQPVRGGLSEALIWGKLTGNRQ